MIFSALRARGFALRRSWDACAARGKVGPVMGLRPLRGPPCIPPEAPPRRFSASIRWRGHASCAAGASLTRSARSGDLPPRRVNAIARSRVGQTPFQPNTMGSSTHFVPRFSPFPRAPCLPEIQGTQEVGLPLAVLGLYPEIFALNAPLPFAAPRKLSANVLIYDGRLPCHPAEVIKTGAWRRPLFSATFATLLHR